MRKDKVISLNEEGLTDDILGAGKNHCYSQVNIIGIKSSDRHHGEYITNWYLEEKTSRSGRGWWVKKL